MKRTILAYAAMGIVGTLLIPAATFAQTTTNTNNIQAQLQTIQNLLSQIKSLQDQIAKLQQQGQQSISSLLTTLKEGDVGENVKTLQALLAADQSIYPEGLITGLYGKLTTKAVKKFQERNGIETVGRVGPKTLAKLSELLGQHPLAFEDDDASINNTTSSSKHDDDDDDDDEDNDKNDNKKENKGIRKLCAIVPPGHLIAPGWLKKQGGQQPIVPLCQIIPPGIRDKWERGSTSTPDTVAPIISSQSAVPTWNSAIVSWITNEPADTQVFYGATSTFGLSTTLNTWLVTSHSQTLTGLTPSTLYFYQVRSKDASSNLATSTGQFTTLVAPDVTAPVISSISGTNIASSSATILWVTNELATSKVYYGTSTPLNLGTASTQTVSGLVTSHNVPLSGLTASTTYYYVVESADASTNTATSSQQSFMTLGL